ncbi:unnamed protein product [Phytomonas sp. EM1]|nr:unnamed protein product [Phytomonas sp. EM1]|eukprot:CCW63072.1 unnamed protein product [Phytomonas sp. isolate EM1]
MNKSNDYLQCSNGGVSANHAENESLVPCESLKGEYVDEVLYSSLEANLFSTAGCILWQTKTLRRKLQYEQKKRQHNQGHVELENFYQQMLDKLEEKSRALSDGLRDLARSMGASYRSDTRDNEVSKAAPIVSTSEQDMKFEEVNRAKPEDYSAEAVVAVPLSNMVSPQQGLNNQHEEPLPKRARLEEGKSNKIGSSSAPKSALARLVAQARATERQLCDDFSTSALSKSEKSHDKMVTFDENLIDSATSNNPASEVHRNTAHDGVNSKTESNLDGNISDDEDFATPLPPSNGQLQFAKSGDLTSNAPERSTGAAEKHPSQMTREEFLSQYKRAPRRGEIGQDADQIAHAEELGYVMSGSQSKASQMYVDRIQRQLHEREAARLHQQFREVEDKLMDQELIHNLLEVIHAKKKCNQ